MPSSILLDLSLPEIFADIPHNTGAIIIYTLHAPFIAFTWIAGRRRSGRPDPNGGS